MLEELIDELTLTPLTKQEVAHAATYGDQEARALVGLYCAIQKVRVGARLRESAHERGVDVQLTKEKGGSPLITRIKEELEKVEKQTARGLAAYARANPLGRWCMTINGVGPVFAAGLLAHIDLKRCCCTPYRHLRGKDRDWTPENQKKGKGIPPHDCPGLVTAGAVWRFAGLDPDATWEKGQVRPHNAALKTLCYLLGRSFVNCTVNEEKVKGKKMTPEQRARLQKRRESLASPAGLYSRLYLERKVKESRNNERGLFRAQAAERLERMTKLRKPVLAEHRKLWEAGMLTDKAIDMRAARYAVKIFLSHYHEVGRKILGLPVIAPWAMAHGGHSHYIAPPNLHTIENE